MPDFTSAFRKHVVAATRPTLFKAGDNQRPERTMSGAAKIFAGFPPPHHLQPGTEDSASSLTTPDMVRSGRVLQPQLNLHLFDTIFHQTY
ncbi:hypothetical protein CLOSYM_03542 [[Clostridium] symbiosum ATCC 14940]|uniref:Uncharacterized protein n=1 Tax=[Clostridium] symbiosum ATCC 14940 TaxID=411472 RepID=A0ABC9TUD6_CLOSY|nr:hypothetical protein CLOSYM_03542 [[Clostridium] symbiosum ATCC 14940]